jgi:hypothetical protein
MFISYASLLRGLKGQIVDSLDFKDSNFRKRGRKRGPVTGGSDLGDLLETRSWPSVEKRGRLLALDAASRPGCFYQNFIKYSPGLSTILS